VRRPLIAAALLIAACGRTPVDLDAGVAPDSGTVSDAGPGCRTELADSPRVRFEFPTQPCRFTLAEAAAGISFQYAVTVDPVDAAFLESEPPTLQTCPSSKPGLGMYVFERLTGTNGKQYCLCDQGLCMQAPPLVGPTPGRSTFSFAWEGREWFGPSDTGNQPGAPFPPGDYVFNVESIVRDVRSDAGTTTLTGKFFFTLTP
jgi:hypothetical protein